MGEMAGIISMFRWILVSVLVLSILVTGCTTNPGKLAVGIGETFTLGISQSARIAGEDLVITFEEVTGDSRCPQGVVCVWAGEARSRVSILHEGTRSSLVLIQPGLSGDSQESFGDYTLTHSLQPYPMEGVDIPPDRYRLTLTVTK
ncbi:MAG: hypothetical protein LUO91_04125 [Methanomicrobiales archaeon]|nr:hypothetical protein [Methanomicrobiales archaeon]